MISVLKVTHLSYYFNSYLGPLLMIPKSVVILGYLVTTLSALQSQGFSPCVVM